METGPIAGDGEPAEIPETSAAELAEPSATAVGESEAPPSDAPEPERPIAMLPSADQPAALQSAETVEAIALTAQVAELAPASAEGEPATPLPEAWPADAASAEEAVAAGFAARRPRIVLWAFVVYDLVWLGLAGALVYYLLNLPAGTATYEATLYEPLLWAAIGMLGLGVFLVPIVWLIARAQTAERTGLLASVVFRGALAVLIGAVLWWGALAVVDYLRLGRVY